MNGFITRIDGLINVRSWGYNPTDRGYDSTSNWFLGPPYLVVLK